MVSPSLNVLSPSMLMIAQCRSKWVIASIAAHVKSLLGGYIYNLGGWDLFDRLDEGDEVAMRSVIDSVCKATINETGLHYSNQLIYNIGLDNPLPFLADIHINTIKNTVDSTSYTILKQSGLNPKDDYTYPYTDMNKLFTDYVSCLLATNLRNYILDVIDTTDRETFNE